MRHDRAVACRPRLQDVGHRREGRVALREQEGQRLGLADINADSDDEDPLPLLRRAEVRGVEDAAGDGIAKPDNFPLNGARRPALVMANEAGGVLQEDAASPPRCGRSP